MSTVGLPDGWTPTTLGALGDYHNGRAFKKTEWRTSGRPIIRIQNLTSPDKPFNYFDGAAEPRHEVTDGDLLLSWAATLEAFRWNRGDAVVNQHIFKVVSHINLDYHFYVLKAAVEDLRRRAHGTGMVHVTRDRFLSVPVMLPPPYVQAEIAARLTELFETVDRGIESYERALRLLKQHRQALLYAIFMRAAVETCPLSTIAYIQPGLAKGRGDETSEPMPYMSTANVQAGRLDLTEIKTIPATPAQKERHRLRPDDVLVLEGGDADKVGRGWIWEGQIDHCLHQNHVFAVRPHRDRLLPLYLAHYINAPQARAYFLDSAKQTTNLASINKRQLSALPVAIPATVEDQERVVESLTRQLGATDALEYELREQIDVAVRLRRTILFAGLRGSLTSALDDSASELDLASMTTKKPVHAVEVP